MSKHEKKPRPDEQDPDDALNVDPPKASADPPEEEPTSQPDGYGSGV
jgi:hypothetical protein